MKDFLLTQILFLLRLKKIEDKLRIYNGYLNYQLFPWVIKNKIPIRIGYKVFKKLRIYSAREIRNSLRATVTANKALFDDTKTYITSFGDPEIIYKSGNRLITDFRNSCREYENKIIPIWKIPRLPKNSQIVFIDDLIGTGKQSTEYIKDISGLLNPSHKAYLFCICATSEGLELINSSTAFTADSNDKLIREQDYYLSDECTYFTKKEKAVIDNKITLLRSRNARYNLGLLLAFEHSAPNNTIPLIWKDGFRYKEHEKEKKWTALLPREY